MQNLFDKLDQKVVSLWKWITWSTFQSVDREFSRSQRWFQRLWIGLIYVITIGVWTVFLNFGNFVWGVQDWIWEWRYARIVKEALTLGQLPLHTDPPLWYDVSRFFSIPDVPLAPQMLLLRFLDPGLYFLINVLLMVSIGYIGCLAIKSHFRLSVFSFTFLALLFNFNGFITAHVGIGHTLFTGYFLLPFFIFLILQLMEGKASKTWFARMGFVLFGIELVGTTQIYVICLMFLGVLLLFAKSDRLHLFKAIIAGVLFNIYRIAPAALALASHSNPPFPGFTTVGDLIKSLTWIIPPSESIVGLPIGWWEFDMYIGLLGLAFVVVFGVVTIWRPQRNPQARSTYRPLVWTSLIFSFFSIGYIYAPINYLPIPLFNDLHVPSRFFLLPLLTICSLACLHFQAWLDQTSLQSRHYFAMAILLALFGHDLFQHARLWRVEYVFEAFSEEPLDLSLRIVNQIDPLYVNVLVISSLATLISIGYILYVLKWKRARAKTEEIN